MLVQDLMHDNIQCCHTATNLEAVAHQMWDNDCGAIPIVDNNGKPIGIITDRDIAMGSSINHRPLWELSAGDIVNGRPVFCCRADDDIETLLNVMREHQVRRVPVTDENGLLCGMVSSGDIIRSAQKRATRGREKISYDQVVSTLKDISQPYSPEQMAQAG